MLAYQRAIELDPNFVPGHNGLGNALSDQGKLEEAIVAYQRAIEIDPSNAMLHSNLGYTLYEQGKLPEAIESHQRAIELDPNYVLAYSNLGLALKDQGKLEEAIFAYQRALEVDPDFVWAYNGLGNILKDQGKLEDAIESYQQALRLPDSPGFPNSAHTLTHNNLGIALRDQGKLEEAIAAYQRAIEIKPDYADPYNNLGNALRDQGKIEEAIAAYQRAIELDPDHALAHNGLGNALRDQGKIEEAIIAYRRAIELDPDWGNPYINLGVTLSDQGNLTEAIIAYQKALELPDDPTTTPASSHVLAHGNLGYAFQQQGNLEAAINQYHKALALDPDDPFAQTKLQEAEHLLILQRNPSPTINEIFPTPEEDPTFIYRRSVVYIIAHLNTGPNITPNNGTGWVVQVTPNQLLILTNRHVVSDDYRNLSDNIEIEFFSTLPLDQRLRRTARILQITRFEDSLDLALLEVNDPPDNIQPLKLSSSPIPVGSPVEIIGHPRTGHPWSMIGGRIANNLDNQLQLSASLAYGASGSPVLNPETREVVGLVNNVDTLLNTNQPHGVREGDTSDVTGSFGYAHPTPLIIQQLQRWGIRPQPQPQNSQPTPPLP